MRIEKYICDFCKKEISKNEIKEFYTSIYRHELCDECYEKAIKLKIEYEEKQDDLYREFKEKILSIKK